MIYNTEKDCFEFNKEEADVAALTTISSMLDRLKLQRATCKGPGYLAMSINERENLIKVLSMVTESYIKDFTPVKSYNKDFTPVEKPK